MLLVSIVVVENGEYNQAVSVLELWFVHYFVEQTRNMTWWIAEGSTP